MILIGNWKRNKKRLHFEYQNIYIIIHKFLIWWGDMISYVTLDNVAVNNDFSFKNCSISPLYGSRNIFSHTLHVSLLLIYVFKMAWSYIAPNLNKVKNAITFISSESSSSSRARLLMHCKLFYWNQESKKLTFILGEIILILYCNL